MIRDGGLSGSGQKPYDRASGSCGDSADLKALVEDCRGRKGSFRLERANIVMQREEGAVPFVHYLDSQDGNNGAYEIRSCTYSVDGCKVFDYGIMRADGSAALDFFVGSLAEAMAFWDVVDVHAQQPREPVEERINSFLKRHHLHDYNRFVSGVDFKSLSDGDYGALPKNGIKRKLFNYRAKAFIVALAAAEEKGFDLAELLDEIAKSRINPLKKSDREPAFDYIREHLQER